MVTVGFDFLEFSKAIQITDEEFLL